MVVVVLTAAAAAIMLRAYNTAPGDMLEATLFSVQQQAAVMAALCAAIFAVITALKSGRPPGFSTLPAAPAVVPPAHTPPAGYGRPAGGLLASI